MRALSLLARPLVLGLFVALVSTVAPAAGQSSLFISDVSDLDEEQRVPESYTESAGRLTPTQILQEKAQVRAAQRMARMAAKDWFGYSQARPRTGATPFTGMYGPHFQGRALGRPAAFHVARPIVVVR